MKPALELLREMRRRRGLRAIPRPATVPLPEPSPEDRPAPCPYFWGHTIKGPCARCGRTFREHWGLTDEGKP